MVASALAVSAYAASGNLAYYDDDGNLQKSQVLYDEDEGVRLSTNSHHDDFILQNLDPQASVAVRASGAIDMASNDILTEVNTYDVVAGQARLQGGDVFLSDLDSPVVVLGADTPGTGLLITDGDSPANSSRFGEMYMADTNTSYSFNVGVTESPLPMVTGYPNGNTELAGGIVLIAPGDTPNAHDMYVNGNLFVAGTISSGSASPTGWAVVLLSGLLSMLVSGGFYWRVDRRLA